MFVFVCCGEGGGGLFLGLLINHYLLRNASAPWSLYILKQVGVQGNVCLNPIQIQKVHYLVRGKIMIIVYVCHTVKRTSLCSCMRVVRNFVWRGDGCGVHEVILWFLRVTKQVCVEPP